MKNIWQGVLIKESLTDTSILPKLKIISTREVALEGEAERGAFHFLNVEVADENLQEIIEFMLSNIKEGTWYFHLVKNGEMIVMFHDKVFKSHKGNMKEIEDIRQYGISLGIPVEQLGLERLFDNPFD